MIDEAPVLTDSLGSLFDFASWLYPRVWTGFVLSWAVTLLPVGILSLAAQSASPQMHEMKVTGHTVHSGIRRHRRNHNAVG